MGGCELGGCELGGCEWEAVSVESCECNYYVCTCIREIRTACVQKRVWVWEAVWEAGCGRL